MPIIRENASNKVAYAAEIAILVCVVLLVFDGLIKLKNREHFFTCFTSFLVTVLLMSLVIFWVFTKIPVTVDMMWPVIGPVTEIGE
jgi:hypothetical protein